MKSLCILITNHALADRAGTELYVRDIAGRLIARGHRPIVYSPVLGPLSLELRSATVPVVDDLDAIGEVPDVIHGQHHLEAMTAILRFPAVPAVFVCHGWMPWQEAPPRFARILRYIAVDGPSYDRLVLQHAIPPAQVTIIRNFVDFARFAPRPPLPPAVQRALLLSNEEGRHVQVVREACARRGIPLDVMGRDFGNSVGSPEAILPEYDLVFGKGRTALEAMAVGTAVVLAGSVGIGPMITTANVEANRDLNFGIRAMQKPFDPDWLGSEIDGYDPADAAEVSSRIRATASLDAVVDRLIATYTGVVAEWSSRPPDDPVRASVELSRYLRWLSPHLNALESRTRALDAQAVRLERANAELAAAIAQVTTDLERVTSERDEAAVGRQRVGTENPALDRAHDTITRMEESPFWKARDVWRKLFPSR